LYSISAILRLRGSIAGRIHPRPFVTDLAGAQQDL